MIGRKREREELENLYRSKKAELVAIYGRHRGGKTFLVDETFKDRMTFNHAGLSPVDMENKKNNTKQQLRQFYKAKFLKPHSSGMGIQKRRKMRIIFHKVCYTHIMRVVTRRYTLELYPTHKQEKLLRQNLGCVRFVYNQCIDHADTAHKEGRRYLGYNGPDGFAALITKLKYNPEYSWLKEADSTSLQNAAKHADKAFLSMFDKRAKHPKYKTRREHRQSYESTCNYSAKSDTYTIRFTDDKHIQLPKIGKVRIRGTVPYFEKLTFATVENTPSNR